MRDNRRNQQPNRKISSITDDVYFFARYTCIPKGKKYKEERKGLKKQNRLNFYDEFKGEDISEKKIFARWYDEIISRLPKVSEWVLNNLKNEETGYIVKDIMNNICDQDFKRYFVKYLGDIPRKKRSKKYYQYAILIHRMIEPVKKLMEEEGEIYDDFADQEIIELLLPKKFGKTVESFPEIDPNFIKRIFVLFPNEEVWKELVGRNMNYIEIRNTLYQYGIQKLFKLRDTSEEGIQTQYPDLVDRFKELLEECIPESNWVSFIRSALLEPHRYKYNVVDNQKEINTWTLLDDVLLNKINEMDRDVIRELLMDYVNARAQVEKDRSIPRRIDFTLVDGRNNIKRVVEEMITPSNSTSKESAERSKKFLCL